MASGDHLPRRGIQELRQLIESGDFERAAGVTPSTSSPPTALVRPTIRVGKRKRKVVIDAGNGDGGRRRVPLFEALGFEVVPLFCEMDGRFPNHHPDPTVGRTSRRSSRR